MVAVTALLAFSAVAHGAAHLKPYQHEVRDAEPQFPTFNLGSIFGGVSSFLAGLTAIPTSTAVTSSKATSVSTTKISTTPVTPPASTSASSIKVSTSLGSTGVSAKASSTASSSSGKASSGTASSGKAVTSQPSSATSVKAASSSPSTLSTSVAASSSTSVKPASGSSSATTPAKSSSATVTSISASAVSASSAAVSKSSAVSASSVAVSKASSAVSASSVASSKSSAVVSASSAASSKSASAVSAKSSKASGSASSKAASASASASKSLASASSSTSAAPSATISNGVVIGATYNSVDQFLGIPYAEPPVGPLRLKPPVAYTGSFGFLNATIPPNACPQQAQNLTGNYSLGGIQPLFNEFIFAPTNQSEDCLTINVYRPNGTASNAALPVLFWIYGGGFEFGATSMYNGSNIVARSVSLGAPIIFVEVNYRLNGFGFLAGADLAAEHSTNLGLRDQRLGLQWNADNIAAFGGDPSKVTLWGESAGAISSCYQLTVNGGSNLYNGKPLFRGSIHNSGSFAPADNASAPQAQAIYDHVVDQTGCSASTAAARLACLRTVDFATLQNATNSVPAFGSYRSADLSYLPRPDTGDTFYAQSAEYSVAAGQWTKTPFIIGDQQDEGTILAIVQNNITNNDDLVNYLATWFPNDPDAISDVQGLAALYPDNITAGQPDGSPYNTGSDNNVYPEYKRLAAILGDIVFIITRRAFLNLGVGQGVSAWTYISTYLQGLSTFGTLHGSDLAYLFDPLFVNSNPTVSIETYYISFVNYLDPNALNTTQTATTWPAYNTSNPLYADFTGGSVGVGNDTFRHEVYDYLIGHVTKFRV